jgi:hypothetical protein
LLIEGARVSRQSVGAAGPCAHFISIAEAVIAAFAQETQKQPQHRQTRSKHKNRGHLRVLAATRA